MAATLGVQPRDRSILAGQSPKAAAAAAAGFLQNGDGNTAVVAVTTEEEEEEALDDGEEHYSMACHAVVVSHYPVAPALHHQSLMRPVGVYWHLHSTNFLPHYLISRLNVLRSRPTSCHTEPLTVR